MKSEKCVFCVFCLFLKGDVLLVDESHKLCGAEGQTSSLFDDLLKDVGAFTLHHNMICRRINSRFETCRTDQLDDPVLCGLDRHVEGVGDEIQTNGIMNAAIPARDECEDLIKYALRKH